MPAINLLPTDLSPKSAVAKVSNILKRLNIIGLVFLIISAITLIVFVILTSFQIRSSTSRQEQLKTSIKSLEQTEQRFVLVKNRIENAKKVLGKETSVEGVENLSSFFTNLPEGVVIREVQISTAKTELSLVAGTSSGLTQILAMLITDDYYKEVKLSSFGFNRNVGYILSLDLSK
ncbi:MAG: hypothetical protein WBD86_00925 [Microgenomates group bacterium]